MQALYQLGLWLSLVFLFCSPYAEICVLPFASPSGAHAPAAFKSLHLYRRCMAKSLHHLGLPASGWGEQRNKLARQPLLVNYQARQHGALRHWLGPQLAPRWVTASMTNRDCGLINKDVNGPPQRDRLQFCLFGYGRSCRLLVSLPSLPPPCPLVTDMPSFWSGSEEALVSLTLKERPGLPCLLHEAGVLSCLTSRRSFAPASFLLRRFPAAIPAPALSLPAGSVSVRSGSFYFRTPRCGIAPLAVCTCR